MVMTWVMARSVFQTGTGMSTGFLRLLVKDIEKVPSPVGMLAIVWMSCRSLHLVGLRGSVEYESGGAGEGFSCVRVG